MHRFRAVNRTRRGGRERERSRAGLATKTTENTTTDRNHRCYKNLKGSPRRYERPAGRAQMQIITQYGQRMVVTVGESS